MKLKKEGSELFAVIGFVIKKDLQFLLKAKLLRDFNSFGIVSQIRAAI